MSSSDLGRAALEQHDRMNCDGTRAVIIDGDLIELGEVRMRFSVNPSIR